MMPPPKDRTNRAPKKERKRSKEDWAPKVLHRLKEFGCIEYACRGLVARSNFYGRRNNDQAFPISVAAVLAEATADLEMEARRRAKDGVKRPVLHKGEPVCVWIDSEGHPCQPQTEGAKQVPLMEHEYSDTLLIFLLKAHNPRKYRERHYVEHTGKKGKPIKVEVVPPSADERRAELFAALGISAGTDGSRASLGDGEGAGRAA